MKFPHFIAHDVLQTTLYRSLQKSARLEGSFSELFIRNMKALEGHPVTLACLSEGLSQTELVRYIKVHPEWTVQCHGSVHMRYDCIDYSDLYTMLKEAKEKLETVFGVSITEFYPPFNKYNDETQKVAKSLGMTEIRIYRKPGHYRKRWHQCSQVDFHFWSNSNMTMVNLALLAATINPIYIIGAPRSGTTALMRYIADDDTLPVKEVEKIWERPNQVRTYYANKLTGSGRKTVLDKNVRNSFRILEIQEMFHGASFIHIIRDGRAVANSWRNWAIKTKKEDQTIEGAITQWVEYVTYILKHKEVLRNYTEVRYEDMCKREDYFQSRNDKWKKSLTESDINIINRIGGPLLKELGYA